MAQLRSDLPAKSISLILPAYNEEAVIATAIEEAVDALEKLTETYEIIVVDDGSVDHTASIVQTYANENASVRLVRHNPNRGYGAAIRTGFAAASCDLVAFTDADCQFDLNELDRFFVLSNQYDVVCGYRIDRKDSFLRCFYSKGYNLLVRCLLGTEVRDIDCAMKVFRRDVIEDLQITGNGFLVNAELLVEAKRQQRSLVEVGVTHRPRTLGESTVSIKHIPQVFAQLLRFWWNSIQFPAAPALTTSTAPAWMQRFGIGFNSLQVILLLVASLFLLTNLGYPLIDRDETRYAEIPREMINTGDWVLPQLNFKTYYDKPPLTYWLCAIAYECFGVSETSARLVPALAALATLAMTMIFASRVLSPRIGFYSGLVLLLSAGFLFTSRYLLLDGVLTAFVAGAMFAAYEAVRPSKSTPKLQSCWWIASAVFTGLAFLTKGPVVLVLGVPTFAAFVWLSEGYSKPDRKQIALYIAVASAVAIPWFVVVHQRAPEFLIEFFYKHNIARFAGAFHEKPFWFFVPVLLIAGHPWSFLTIPLTRFLFGRGEAERQRRSPVLGYMLIWAVWTFVFFSLSRCKLPTYLMPAGPAFAILMGHFFGSVIQDTKSISAMPLARMWSPRAAVITTTVAGLGFALYQYSIVNEQQLLSLLWITLWAGLLVAALVLIRRPMKLHREWSLVSVAMVAFATMVLHQSLPMYSHQQTLLAKESSFSEHLAADPLVPVATVSHEFSEIPFYLNRDDVSNYRDVSDHDLRTFVQQSGHCYVLVNDLANPTELQKNLPLRARVTKVAEQGDTQLLDIRLSSPSFRLAAKHADVTDDRKIQ